jgi:hypothetical protein
MKIIAIGMMALAISCGSTTTRQAGNQQGGITKIETVQLEDMEFTISNLVEALASSAILDKSKTVYILKGGKFNDISGVENKSTTKMETNGHRIQLTNYLINDLIKMKMCDVVTTESGYNYANYSLKVLIVNELVTGDENLVGKKDQSNRVVIHFELFDIDQRKQNVVFASSEIVQKIKK